MPKGSGFPRLLKENEGKTEVFFKENEKAITGPRL